MAEIKRGRPPKVEQPRVENPQVERPQEQPQEPEQKSNGITVQPVFGAMHHLFKNVRIDGPTQFDEIDSWLDSQIKAGKLTLS